MSAQSEHIAANQLNVEVESGRPPVVTLRVTGEVDMLTSPILRDSLDRQLRASRPTVLDLRPVTFLGTAGLRVLIDWFRDAEQWGTKVAVIAPHHPVRHVLDVTDIGHSMPLFETEREAIVSVSGPKLQVVN